jgi:YVTN family beta-propeller protein
MMHRFGAQKRSVVAAMLAVGVIAMTAGVAAAATPNLYAFTFAVTDAKSTANDVLFDGQNMWVAVEVKGHGVLEKITDTGAVISATEIGVAPIEMAYDGAKVWVTNYTSSTLSIVDQQGVLVHTIFLPLAAHPEGIFFDGKYIWVANNGVGQNSVSKFDPESMRLIASYPVGLAPDAFAFDGTSIWVTNSYSDNVMKLDRETGEIIRTFPTGEYPLSIVFDGKDMWIGNGDVANPNEPPLATASLTELRVAGGVNLGTFASGNAVRGLVYDGTSIWACNDGDNTVTRIRVSDGARLGTYPTGIAPRGIAFDGVRIWISNTGQNTVTVVTPQPDALVIRPSIGFYIPAITLTPRLLSPVVSGVEASAPDTLSITPRVSPAIAALGGILDALLDN